MIRHKSNSDRQGNDDIRQSFVLFQWLVQCGPDEDCVLTNEPPLYAVCVGKYGKPTFMEILPFKLYDQPIMFFTNKGPQNTFRELMTYQSYKVFLNTRADQ